MSPILVRALCTSAAFVAVVFNAGQALAWCELSGPGAAAACAKGPQSSPSRGPAPSPSNGGGGGNNSRAAISNAIGNTLQAIGRNLGSTDSDESEPSQNQIMMRLEQEKAEDAARMKRFDADLKKMKTVSDIKDCNAITFPSLHQQCVDHFLIALPALEAERAKKQSAMPTKVADELLAEFQPEQPRSRSKSRADGKQPNSNSGNKSGADSNAESDKISNNIDCVALEKKESTTKTFGGTFSEIIIKGKNNCDRTVIVKIYFDESKSSTDGGTVRPGQSLRLGSSTVEGEHKFKVRSSQEFAGK